ncbi:MAG: hypothetical protein JWN31_753 [Frankiales bacterium]|nr:hypothetical protein [Frankiales bacterium]
MAIYGLIVLMLVLLVGTVLFALGKGTSEGEQREVPKLREPKP